LCPGHDDHNTWLGKGLESWETQTSGCHAGSVTPLSPAAHNYMQTGSWYDTPDDDGYVDSDESAPPSDDEDLDDDDELPPCMCFQDLH